MTTVLIPQADLRRSVSPDMFDDILTSAGLPAEEPEFSGSGQMLAVAFVAELDDVTATAVRDRLLTSDGAQESARATLRADRDALPADDPLRRLYDYVLGDSGL